MKFYKVYNPFSEFDTLDENSITIEWNKLPKSFMRYVPDECLHNIYALNKYGNIIEKTVIWINPMEELYFEFLLDTVKIGDKVILGVYEDDF